MKKEKNNLGRYGIKYVSGRKVLRNQEETSPETVIFASLTFYAFAAV